MRFRSYDTEGFYDEMFQADGRPRPEAHLLLDTVEALSDGHLLRYKHAAERLLLRMGITFNVYGDSAGDRAHLPLRSDPAHRSRPRMGPHRARPQTARPRAQRLHRRYLPRPEDPQRRHHPQRSHPFRRLLPQAVPGSESALAGVVPHHRHRPGARPRRESTTCSKTTCASPRASPTCSRTAR